MAKLDVGEKYLNIVLLNDIKVVAFPNKQKTSANQPDFKGDGVAVWVNEKKEAKPDAEVIKVASAL